MRLSGRDGIARSNYMTASGQRLIVMRTFVKKTRSYAKAVGRKLEIRLKMRGARACLRRRAPRSTRSVFANPGQLFLRYAEHHAIAVGAA